MNFNDLLEHVKNISLKSNPKKEIPKEHAQAEKIESQETHPLPNNPEFWQNRQGVFSAEKQQTTSQQNKSYQEIIAKFSQTFNDPKEHFTIKQAQLSLKPESLEKILSLVENDNFSTKAILALFNSPKFSDEEKNSWQNLEKTIDYLSSSSNETKKYYSKILTDVFDKKDTKNEKIINKIRENNGLVDLEKFNFALKLADKTTPFIIEKLLDIYSITPDAEFAYDKLETVFKTPVNVAKNILHSLEFCFEFDDKSNLVEKQENIEYLREIAKNIKNLTTNSDFYNFIKTPENKQLLLDLSKFNLENSDLKPLYEIVKSNKDEGEFNQFCKEKLFQFAKTNASYKNFLKIYNGCIREEKQGGFDEDLFDKLIKINALFPEFIENAQENNLFIDLIKENTKIKDLNFKTRIKIFNSLTGIKEILQQNKSQGKIENSEELDIICRIFKEIELSLLDSDTILDVDDISRKDFIVNVLKSINKDNPINSLTDFEITMQNSIPLLKEMKQGLDLKYSRKDFLKDLTNICNNDEKIKILSKKAQITPILDKNNNITGYNGIINLKNLDKNNEFEYEIFKLANKFIYENKITTKDENLNKALNTIIKALPEFINIIGKKQNPVHSYPLDIHTLLVLANSIDNPDYKKLTTIDKIMLKLTCLIHDISKCENIADEGHYNQSAIISKGISKRFFTNPFAQDRVYDLVKNHHWLEKLNTSYNDKKNETIRKIAYRFRQPNDYDIAKIFAKADLQSVSDKFFNEHKKTLESKDIDLIDEELDWFYSTGCAVFSDSICAKSKLENHKQVLDGVEYKVIDFNKIDDNEDMGKYGFQKGKKKKDLYLLVHMMNEKGAAQGNFEAVKSLSSSINKGVLSQSLITPCYKKTFMDSCGVLLSNINTNIITMSPSNQTSGVEKGFSNIAQLLHNDKNYRTFFKEQFLKYANIDKDSIADIEFANFYRKNIAKKNKLRAISR